MARVGIISRLMLILMVALFAVILATIAIDHAARRTLPSIGVPLPRIVHAASFITLIRGADLERRRTILRASNNTLLRVWVGKAPPPPDPGETRAPLIETRLARMIGSPVPGLEAYTDDASQRTAKRIGIEGRLVRTVVPLDDGDFLSIRWISAPKIDGLKLLGLAPSAWAGILGFAVGALALVAAIRELRPLRRLTESVSAFDGGRPDGAIEEEGAPDIRRLVREFRSMQERVAGLLAERSFLIGAISHDLRTYLTRLRLRTESIGDADMRERMVGDLDAMTDLIDTSLAFARGTTSSQSRVSLDLSDLVAVEVEEHNALGAALTIRATYAGDAMVVGDPVALRRVVSNILDNALKFARSAVTVDVQRGSAFQRILIEDDGPGIPEAERGSVFDPYYRVDRSRSRSTGGTGLGLAIARQIVEAHRGTIEVAAARLNGAAFTVTLPASPR